MTQPENTKRTKMGKGKDLEDSPVVKKGNPSGAKEEEVSSNPLLVAACLMFFFTVGPGLIMVNKYILRGIKFDAPITLTFYSSTFCSLVVWMYVFIFNVKLKNAKVVTREFYMKNIMPIGFLQGATILLGMSSYLFLSVSFIQMLKASTPVMIVSLLTLFGMGTPSRAIMGSVLIISLGTVLSGYGEINFNILGVACMLGAQATEALRLVFTQKLLKNLNFSVVESLCFVTPAAAFWTLLFAASDELRRVDLQIARDNAYIFIIAGFMAVGVNTINSVVVKFTGSLMMKLLSTARNASLVLLNVALFGETVTRLQLPGYVISLAGFLAYNYFRNKEKQNKVDPKQEPRPKKVVSSV